MRLILGAFSANGIKPFSHHKQRRGICIFQEKMNEDICLDKYMDRSLFHGKATCRTISVQDGVRRICLNRL